MPPTQNPSALSCSRAGDVQGGLERCQHARLRVVVPGRLLEGAAGVAPGHHEDLQTLVQREADERVLRPQIEDVVLVDERRDDQQGPRVHVSSARRVLNELRHWILIDHRTRCDREVASDCEGALVAHLHAAAQRVGLEVLQPRHQARSARLRGKPQHFRVAAGEIGGSERVEVLAQREGQASVSVGGQLRGVYQLLEPARVQQIGIPQQTKEWQLLPLGCGKAAVGARGVAG